ncbi:MAG TPA: sulfatase-like hydrolase/transferase [Chitinophagaceae bacterium]|nr:sulfatase-like hydrolase/transferase [Chitinophagaceae bacterium]
MRKYLIYAALLLIISNASAQKIVQQKIVIKPRNIVLIIADDVGAEQVKPYANTLQYSSDIDPTELPTVRMLRNAGIRFTQAWSNPYCSPTRAGIYTGQYSCTHGIYSPIQESSTEQLEAHPLHNIYTPLPLKMPCNYRKGLFGKWHLGYDVKLPLENGWDHYAGSLGGELPSYFHWTKTENGEQQVPCSTHATIDLTTDARKWIHARCVKGDPFLAVLAFNAPHGTGTTSTEWLQGDLSPICVSTTLALLPQRQIYLKQLECLDHSVGNLIAYMKANFPYELDNTIFIFIGDNGTPDAVSELVDKHILDAKHFKGSLYQGGIHVPFIIADGHWLSGVNISVQPNKYFTRINSPGSDCDALVHTRDIYATILDLTGVANPESGTKSYSLVKFMTNPKATGETYLFTENEEGQYAIRTSKYKLIRYDKRRSGTEYEFYDISNNKWDENPIANPLTNPLLGPLVKLYYQQMKNKLQTLICQ